MALAGNKFYETELEKSKAGGAFDQGQYDNYAHMWDTQGGTLLSYEDWKKYVTDNPDATTPAAQAYWAAKNSADNRAQIDKEQTSQDDTQAKLRAFADEMNKPLDFNDPKVKIILAQATGAATQDASNRGIQGGLSVANTQQAQANAAAGMDAQRKQLGLQALSTSGSQGLGLAQLRENQYQYDSRAQYEQQMNQYNQARQANASGWGLAGGVVGGIAGAYFGGPAGAAAGYSAGSALGAGLGGSNYGPPPVDYSSATRGYNRSRSGSGRSSGGLSGA